MRGLDELPDDQLLKAFAEVRDEDAFTELVHRHGPLVWSVCHRVLGRSADIEDAAQAAFLMLARQAPRWRAFPSTGPWLHRVAHNIAVNVLKARKVRKRRENEVATMTQYVDRTPTLSDDQGALLHQEIDALPEKYRQAVILCHLEGKSLEQAAAVMARPKATVGTWVARGRERLKNRLARRGLVLSLGVLTALLSAEAGAAELPATFAASTSTAAALFVAGASGGSVGAVALSPRSVSLTEGALRTMSYAKLQMVVLILFALLSIGAGTGWLVNRATGSEGSGAGAQAVPAVAPKPVNATVAEAPPAVAVGKEERDALVTGNTAFALKMYGELSAKEGNLFFSPYSISSALGMTYAGARGNAAREIKDALSFGLEQDKLHAAFKALKDELAASTRKSGQKLNIANGLCLTGGDARDEFKALIRDRYDAEIFAGDLDKINGWVKKKTEGKIEKILEELHPLTVCVLLNAVYFKGVWANQFKKSDTRELPFKLSATNQVRVPQMYQKGNFKLLELNGFQAACLPYKGGTMAMIVLLSDAVDGLPELEKQLNAQNLSQWLVGLDKTMAGEIDLYLPRFRLETKYDLIPPFRNLGMKDAFTDTAGSFSGINEIITKINQIRHKAFCEVNEEGTEAAAATAVEAVTMGLFGTPTFRADHPFIYLIRDNETGSILFMGRMMNPKG